MANYKELYDLSLRLFFEEKARFNRIDQKASWFFSALTLLLAIAGFFAKWMIDSLIPPKDALDVILLLVGIILVGAIGLSWYLIFRVLRVAGLANIPLDDQSFNLFANHNDATIYWITSQSIKQFRDANIEITNRKSEVLANAYKTMVFSLVTIIVFGFLYTGRLSIEKNQDGAAIQKGESSMCEQENKPTPQGQQKPAGKPQATEPTTEKPDTSVSLLNPQYLTEGYDPKLMIKTGQNNPSLTKTGEKQK